MVTNDTLRLLLRAEVRWNGLVSVGYTVELAPGRAVVRTQRVLPIGVTVELCLSFPRLVESLVLEGTVTAIHDPQPHEQSPGMTIALADGEASGRLAALLARMGKRTMSEPPANDTPYRVLLVDDNGLIRDMFSYGVRKYFRLHNGAVTVDLAENGEQAWRMLHDASYDLAIVDFYLPVMNGSELVARMRREVELADVPVVVISVGGREARAASMAAGADLFLDKPIALRDLFNTLERLTAREQHV